MSDFTITDEPCTFTPPEFSPDVKRFGIPINVSVTCPMCGEIIVRNLKDSYFSYAWFNCPITMTFAHENEGGKGDDWWHEWSIVVRLNLSIDFNLPDSDTED